MLSRFVALSSLGVFLLALSAPLAHASEITGVFDINGSTSYTTSADGAKSFFPDDPVATPQTTSAISAFSAAAPASSSNTFTTNSFIYNGAVTPVVLTSTANGITTTFTFDSLNSLENIDGGYQVQLSGMMDQTGYDPTMATATFILQSQYIGDNINLMMFRGVAQAVPTVGVAPEPTPILLMGTGLLGLAGIVRLRRRMQLAKVAPSSFPQD
ncbi:MAG TPA: PEP-CTERM sorting domain-containing protein [Acidobacteriaceae bacterium]|nr:PEP-CTERM sorting domain-containing protein [Acidobacteriaceae bacterium]